MRSEQLHMFTEFPPNQDEDDDKADLLKKPSSTQQMSFWTFEYYQRFFNVDTYEVGYRLLGSVIPNPRSTFLHSYVRPNPDLYGPFWVCCTLLFTIAIAGNVANYLQDEGLDFQWHYDFHKVTFAATSIFLYWWLVPALIWSLLWFRRNLTGINFLELLCIYGYSLTIYIPISVLWVIPVEWLRWLLVMLGMGLSGSVLVLALWPVAKLDSAKLAVILSVLVIALHGGLALGFMFYFFHVPPSAVNPVTTSLPPVTVVPTMALPT